MRDPHEDNHYWEYREEENMRRCRRIPLNTDPFYPDYLHEQDYTPDREEEEAV